MQVCESLAAAPEGSFLPHLGTECMVPVALQWFRNEAGWLEYLIEYLVLKARYHGAGNVYLVEQAFEGKYGDGPAT